VAAVVVVVVEEEDEAVPVFQEYLYLYQHPSLHFLFSFLSTGDGNQKMVLSSASYLPGYS
jgi:hypothetical protein